MKKLLTLMLVFMMGFMLCSGQILAEEPDDGGSQEPELYDSSAVVLDFTAPAVNLTDDDDGGEEPCE